jgi:hypothetical protein
MAGIHIELRVKFKVTWNRNPQSATTLHGHTVGDIDHHTVITTESLAGEFHDNCLREWTKDAVNTVEESMNAKIVEVIVKMYCPEQLTSGRILPSV